MRTASAIALMLMEMVQIGRMHMGMLDFIVNVRVAVGTLYRRIVPVGMMAIIVAMKMLMA